MVKTSCKRIAAIALALVMCAAFIPAFNAEESHAAVSNATWNEISGDLAAGLLGYSTSYFDKKTKVKDEVAFRMAMMEIRGSYSKYKSDVKLENGMVTKVKYSRFIKVLNKLFLTHSNMKTYLNRNKQLSGSWVIFPFGGIGDSTTIVMDKVTSLAGYRYTIAGHWVDQETGVKGTKVYITVEYKNGNCRYFSYTNKEVYPKGRSIASVKGSRKAFTAKWSKVSGVTGYQVSYSTSSKFSSSKTVTVKGSSATSKKISRLKAHKTYYVKMRTNKKVSGETYYSSWSSYKKVKTK